MKLRERYARSMERRLKSRELLPQRITISTKDGKVPFAIGPLSWEELRVEKSYLHRRKPQEALIYLRQEGTLGDEKAFYWFEAHTYLEKDLLEQNISRARNLNDLLSLCDCEKVHHSHNTISLVNAEEDGRILIQLQRDIIWNDYIIGREKHRFDLNKVELSVPGEVMLVPMNL